MTKKLIIEDILLKMNYDLSKTLTENKEFITEQRTPYYDSQGYLRYVNGPVAIPQGGTAASKVYPNLKPSEYPNFNFTLAAKAKPVPFNNSEMPQSDVLGPQGSFPKSLGIDKKTLETNAKLQKISPSEYTKNLSPEKYQEFMVAREKINKLPPSFRWTEYNKKLSEAFQEYQNYDSNIESWYTANERYAKKYEYYTALYYPEKWSSDYSSNLDKHDVLLLVGVGVFIIPLLAAAAGASLATVELAMLGAQIVSTAADTADALAYLNEGDLEMAGLSAIFAVLPFVPNLARYTKGLINTAVKKYAEKKTLTKIEQEVIEQLSKKETQEQITKAAEKQAAKNMTPEMSKSVIKGKNAAKKIIKGISKSPTVQFMSTLAGFYLVGQGYEKAVEAYKNSQLSPINIYQKLVQEKKISDSWDDLKWMFGSSGSNDDNTKLAAAMLSGYVGGDETNMWLYNNPKFQTETWKQKWAPIAKQEIEDKEYEKSVSNYQNLKPEEKSVVIKKTQENMLKDDDGTVRSVDELDKTAQQLNNMDDLWDVSKPFNKK